MTEFFKIFCPLSSFPEFVGLQPHFYRSFGLFVLFRAEVVLGVSPDALAPRPPLPPLPPLLVHLALGLGAEHDLGLEAIV